MRIIAAMALGLFVGINLLSAAPDSLDPTFHPDFRSFAQFLPLPEGKILICGRYTNSNELVGEQVTRLMSDGSVDPTFTTGSSTPTQASISALQPDGKILLGGAFTNYNGVPRNLLVRLNTDGTVDEGFVPNLFGSSVSGVQHLALQVDGKVLVAGGHMTAYNQTTSRSVLARLNSDGTLDTTFKAGNTGFIAESLAIQPDGKILFCQALGPLLRFTTTGAIDPTFNAPTNFLSLIKTIQVQPDGKILIGGPKSVGAVTALARLNTNGTLDASFAPVLEANGPPSVRQIQIQRSGRILVIGSFTNVNGASRNNLVALKTDGTLDESFVPELEPIPLLNPMQCNPLSNGKILIWGGVRPIGSDSHQRVFRLVGDAPELVVQRIENDLKVTWPNPSYQLQDATESGGPFANVTNAVSPYVTPATGPRQFFRLIAAE